MGFYIEVPRPWMKAIQLVADYGARAITREDARKILSNPDRTEGVVVVVENPTFEAAGYAYGLTEFERFMDPEDRRPMSILAMPREKAELMSNFGSGREDWDDINQRWLR